MVPTGQFPRRVGAGLPARGEFGEFRPVRATAGADETEIISLMAAGSAGARRRVQRNRKMGGSWRLLGVFLCGQLLLGVLLVVLRL